MTILRTSALTSAVLGLLPLLSAQGLSLDKSGGAIGGSADFRLQGPPNALHLVLVAFNEVSTPVPWLGITLDIPTTFFSESMSIPGSLGFLDANGAAAATLAIPDDTALAGLCVSAQGIADASPFIVSNLVRVTLQERGKFAAPLHQPLLPIGGGGAVARAERRCDVRRRRGPAGPALQSRAPEEWSFAGTTVSVGQYSQTTACPTAAC
jgi:hypothetical protein